LLSTILLEDGVIILITNDRKV